MKFTLTNSMGGSMGCYTGLDISINSQRDYGESGNHYDCCFRQKKRHGKQLNFGYTSIWLHWFMVLSSIHNNGNPEKLLKLYVDSYT